MVALANSAPAGVRCAGGRDGDYDRDLAKAGTDIARLTGRVRAEPGDAEAATRLVYRRYHLATLTGDLEALAQLAKAVRETVDRLGANPDVISLEATVHVTLHRLDLVRPTLAAAPRLLGSPTARALVADVAVQDGDFTRARQEYEAISAVAGRWEDMARLAYVEAITGRRAAADRLYAAAQQPLTIKQARAFAWLETRRGALDLTAGRYADADRHYARAEAAYSGFWLVEEHRAELAAARGCYEEAIDRYALAVTEAPRPELQQAFGDVLARAGRPQAAADRHEQAVAAFRASAERGEVHYFHHLADFYTRIRPDPAEAVQWASRDLSLRRGPLAHAAMASALHLQGHVADAVGEIEIALASGVLTAELLAEAATIYRTAGRTDEADALNRSAARIDPRHGDFRARR